jgi:ATP-dependent exoDNAse (exonuclease V) alpha subunit
MNYFLSEEQQNFLHKIINFEGPNVLFVTGSAGTGKSTLLHAVQDYDEDTIVLAPTGIAAIQAKGQTIHSFFGLKPNSSVSKMRNDSVKALKNANRIIIDEISMVRSDLMELMNSIMQSKLKNRLPFGGIPMIVFGDQSQIEPVVKEDEIDFIVKEYGGHFFFDAPAVKANPIEIIKLNTIYRQQGEIEFIEALQALRAGKTDKLHIFNQQINVPDDDCVRITYTNKRCSLINETKLKQIDSRQYVSTGVVDGEFLQSEFPAEEKFHFKLYARVMLLVNNREIGNEYVNGDIGTIVSIDPSSIIVQLDRGKRLVKVEKYTWEKIAYSHEDGKLKSGVVGTYTQLPMKLSWAMTCHRVQGQTFHNKVHIELETKSFAHGLLYVALSRATKLDNLTIGRRIYPDDIVIDERVNNWCVERGLNV